MRNVVLLFILFIPVEHLFGQNLGSQLSEPSQKIRAVLGKKTATPVLVASFLDMSNTQTAFGKYLADKFTVQLRGESDSFEIIDRTAFDQILKENKLAAEQILDPSTIAQLGKWTGAKSMITGSYTVLGSTVDLTIKAVSIERGTLLTSIDCVIPLTADLKALLNINGPIDPVLGPLPSPRSNCAEKITCVVCVTNLSSPMIVVSPRLGNQMSGSSAGERLPIKQGERKCWMDMWFSHRDKVDHVTVSVYVDRQFVTKYTQEIVPCESYNITHK